MKEQRHVVLQSQSKTRYMAVFTTPHGEHFVISNSGNLREIKSDSSNTMLEWSSLDKDTTATLADRFGGEVWTVTDNTVATRHITVEYIASVDQMEKSLEGPPPKFAGYHNAKGALTPKMESSSGRDFPG